jgi:hypothetical protein
MTGGSAEAVEVFAAVFCWNDVPPAEGENGLVRVAWKELPTVFCEGRGREDLLYKLGGKNETIYNYVYHIPMLPSVLVLFNDSSISMEEGQPGRAECLYL